ncbi:hypothetical protein JM47_01315 [Ureaplasma diversum]|uniref:Lipoprotein n=1 Tax=Ureaplasma diversum TaxID=42094 RepID=A0A0C5RLF3_9BACT|nr:hypothetical protein [Ureaplasma diversum]AJQ45257.1 hypothetical protein JM47_01315 [Ureaplasma diversum]
MAKLYNKKRSTIALAFGLVTLASITTLVAVSCNKDKSSSELKLDADFKTNISFNKEALSPYSLSNLTINYQFINDQLRRRNINDKTASLESRRINSMVDDIIKDIKLIKDNFNVNKDILIAPLSSLNPQYFYEYELVDNTNVFSIENKQILHLKHSAYNGFDLNQTNHKFKVKIKDPKTNQSTIKEFSLNLNKIDLDAQANVNNTFNTYLLNELNIKAEPIADNYAINGANNTRLEQWNGFSVLDMFDWSLNRGLSLKKDSEPLEITPKNSKVFNASFLELDLSIRSDDHTKIKVDFMNENNEVIKSELLTKDQINRSLITYKESSTIKHNLNKELKIDSNQLVDQLLKNEPNAKKTIGEYIKQVHEYNFNSSWPINETIIKTGWFAYHYLLNIPTNTAKIAISFKDQDQNVSPVVNYLQVYKQPKKANINYLTTQSKDQTIKYIDSVKETKVELDQFTKINNITILRNHRDINQDNQRFILANAGLSYEIKLVDQDNNEYIINYLVNASKSNILELPAFLKEKTFKLVIIKTLTLRTGIEQILVY